MHRPVGLDLFKLLIEIWVATYGCGKRGAELDWLAVLEANDDLRGAVQARTYVPVTYNLTIADLHTYYVEAGSTPVLVHNSGGAPNPWANSELWTQGQFPVGGALDAGGPANGILYRTNPEGAITSYAVYDGDGIILQRVDLIGAAHGGVETPHVQTFSRNVTPDGRIFPQQSKIATPTGPDDVPPAMC